MASELTSEKSLDQVIDVLTDAVATQTAALHVGDTVEAAPEVSTHCSRLLCLFDWDNTLFPSFVQNDFSQRWKDEFQPAEPGFRAILDGPVALGYEKLAAEPWTKFSVSRSTMASEEWKNKWSSAQKAVKEIAAEFDRMLSIATSRGCTFCIVTAGLLEWIADSCQFWDEVGGTSWASCLVFPQDASMPQLVADSAKCTIPVYSKCGEGGDVPKIDLMLSAIQAYANRSNGGGKDGDEPKTACIFCCGDGSEETAAAEKLKADYEAMEAGGASMSVVRLLRVTIDNSDLSQFAGVLKDIIKEAEGCLSLSSPSSY